MDTDKSLLQRAIDLADKGIKSGGGPFGAVISRDSEIISEAYNRVVLGTDPTAHAEIIAIREAATLLKTHKLNDCTLYTSCEPCPMCLGAIYWAGIKKVVYASDREDAEKAGFSDKFIYDEIILDPGMRKVTFIKIDSNGGDDIFNRWKQFENKITY